jgi:ATP-dependent DNA ligase
LRSAAPALTSPGNARAWLKMRVNQWQEFVIGGYTMGGATFDALIFGHYEGEDLIYVPELGTASRPGFVRSL